VSQSKPRPHAIQQISPHTGISQQTSPCAPQQTSSRDPAANVASIQHSRPRLTHRIPQQISHCAPLVVRGAYGVDPLGRCPCLPVSKLFLSCRRRSGIAGACLSLYARLISHFNITNTVIQSYLNMSLRLPVPCNCARKS